MLWSSYSWVCMFGRLESSPLNAFFLCWWIGWNWSNDTKTGKKTAKITKKLWFVCLLTNFRLLCLLDFFRQGAIISLLRKKGVNLFSRNALVVLSVLFLCNKKGLQVICLYYPLQKPRITWWCVRVFKDSAEIFAYLRFFCACYWVSWLNCPEVMHLNLFLTISR